ncbi:MAG TPA: ATP-binding protein [Bryobacteraceae bacterium]|nr:ATP-binding protein [Bryobacteraceae bacterium]
MMPIRVLLLENSADTGPVAGAMEQGGIQTEMTRVETERELREALERGGWDVILAGDGLHGCSGAEALRICRELRVEAPVIVVSGVCGEESAVEMMRQGAADYVLKTNLVRLPAAIFRAIGDARARAESPRAQGELFNSREWLYATLRSVGEAVIATDAHGSVGFMNPIAEKLTGHKEREAAGRPVDFCLNLAGREGEPLREPPLQLLLSRPVANVQQEFTLVRRTGETVSVIGTAAPIRNGRGEMIGAVFTFRDITGRKRAEEQIRQANQEMHQFVRSISHDLQEPLRMISLYAEMIRRKFPDADPDTQEYLRFVMGGAERMSALLTSLRAYAEISSAAPPEPEEADAEVALQQVLVNLAAIIDETSAVIVHDSLPRVAVHSAHLVQLFQNLISNSIKYRREGHPPTIAIASARKGSRWQFSFSDNGSGVAPEYAPRVFDFFQRFHGPGIPGTGMGLAICKRIVQRYGGRIWLESTPGVGSVFHFTLPALETAPPDPADLD